MKGERMLRILEVLTDVALDTTAVFAAIMTAGHGASSGRLQKEYERHRGLLTDDCPLPEKQRWYQNLDYLQKQGLVRKEHHHKKSLWRITKIGVQKLKQLKKYSQDLPASRSYVAHASRAISIVSFDIPEKERKKRNWLRVVLRNFGFQMVQKSVWVGKIKLPPEFIADLNRYHIGQYVHLFSVNRSGSLVNVLKIS